MRRHARAAALLVSVVLTAAAAYATEPAPREVLFVGNNWDGTADVIGVATFERIARLNIIPDRAEREMEITTDPAKLGYFLAIRQLIGEGHDQFVDDMFSSND